MNNNKRFKFMIFLTILMFLFVLLPFNYSFSADKQTNSLDISSDAYFLIDNKTNKILYSKNEHEKMYPASTTKILTAIIVLENSNLNDIVTASYDSLMTIPEGYSTANIQVDEKLTVEQLLELLLVHSANDAANVLAEFIGGSNDSFVTMMNTKLNELGLNNSHFTNTYGLHDENHYTTAHDLAYIMKYCLKNETFRKIAGQASCAIPATNKYGPRSYSSTNELLNPNNSNYYKNLIAGKTGFTTQAKECLVSAAFKNDLELIGVILHSNSRFTDTKRLFEYGYSNYSLKTLVNTNDIITSIEVSNATRDTKQLNLLSNDNISVLISNNSDLDYDPEITLNEKISAPIEENDVLGKITYSIDGISYSADIIAEHTVEQSFLPLYIAFGIGFIIIIFVFNLIRKKKLKNKYKYNRIKKY